MKWYRKAAEQGYAKAQTRIGLMYQEGKGVPKDQALAKQWLERAAEQGYEPGLLGLYLLLDKMQEAEEASGG